MSEYKDNEKNTSQIEIKENTEGDLYFELSDDLLERLGWQKGDAVKFIDHNEGFIIKKVKYETIQLDLTKEELYKYMLISHENNMSLNEWIEHVLESFMQKDHVQEDNLYKKLINS